ncbi:MAG: PEGA domain-containing protein [Lentisphaeria bacterium]
MKLFFESGQYPGRIVNINDDNMTIGRGEDNSLVLRADGISRHHCRLYRRDSDWFIEDLGSTNGVVVNGVKITEPRKLNKGDRLELYNQSLVFTDEAGIAVLQSKTGDTGEELRGGVPAAGAVAGEAKEAKENEKEEEEAGVPWGHVALLAVLAGIIGWAIYSTVLVPSDGVQAENAAQDGEKQDESVADTDDASTFGDEGIWGEKSDDPDNVRQDDAENDDFDDLFGSGQQEETTTPVIETQGGDKTQGTAKKHFTIVINSDPEVAMLSIDDQEIGKTPAVVQDIEKGQHAIRLEKAGYEELKRLVFVPDTVPEDPYKLKIKPGNVRVSGAPRGATVFHGSQVLGQLPVLAENLPIGENELKVVAYGYKLRTVTVDVDDMRGTEKKVELESMMGGVEILTLPAGFEVYIDGAYKGKTKQASDVARSQSLPFAVQGLRAGEHRVKVSHPNHAEKEQMVKIKPNVTSSAVFRLWVLDTKLVLKDGTTKYGMLVSKNEFGDITISVYPDRKSKTYLKDQVTNVEPVDPDEAAEVMDL